MISNLTSSVNINILNMIVARFDFQKASETERINLCKKDPSLLGYITLYTVVIIHKTWMNMDSKREREREKKKTYTVY